MINLGKISQVTKVEKITPMRESLPFDMFFEIEF